jgi:4-hydroxythreonine-4-phosphate dehydrogenase
MAESLKPILAVTMGDAAGIGPEVIVGAWGDPQVHDRVRPMVLGHPEILRRAARLLHSEARIIELARPAALEATPTDRKTIPCIKCCADDVLEVPPGRVDARAGEAALQAIRTAAGLALENEVAGIVTAPLSKAALHAAGHNYPGHTELLAELCGVDDFAMMLFMPPEHLTQSKVGLGVVHTTLHCALRRALDDLSTANIVSKCRLVHKAMKSGFGVDAPRIGVCALNPHGGEDGLFGSEEVEIIRPAVEQVRDEGLDASGPYPADTLMVRAAEGEFDAVVAMYHDQGHIALKLINLHSAVNVTLGLPIVRTSAAHGTAFDIAWQGKADASGMTAAILAAAELAKRGFRFRCGEA